MMREINHTSGGNSTNTSIKDLKPDFEINDIPKYNSSLPFILNMVAATKNITKKCHIKLEKPHLGHFPNLSLCIPSIELIES